jgi:WD40 repeat protein
VVLRRRASRVPYLHLSRRSIAPWIAWPYYPHPCFRRAKRDDRGGTRRTLLYCNRWLSFVSAQVSSTGKCICAVHCSNSAPETSAPINRRLDIYYCSLQRSAVRCVPAGSSSDRMATLAHSLEPLQTLEGHTDRVWHLAWSPDGTSSSDLGWHEQPVTAVAAAVAQPTSQRVAAAGTSLASCSGDRTVRIWQQSRIEGRGWRCAAVLEDTHTKSIRCCCWSPGGTHLATASFDGTTAIWQLQGGVWEEVSCCRCCAGKCSVACCLQPADVQQCTAADG